MIETFQLTDPKLAPTCFGSSYFCHNELQDLHMRRGNLMNELISILKVNLTSKYATFYGRDSRKQYWLWFLSTALIDSLFALIPVANAFISLFLLIPGLAAATRRLHDSGRSGKWLLLLLVLVIGWIWLAILLCLPSATEPNEYGSPKPLNNGNSNGSNGQRPYR